MVDRFDDGTTVPFWEHGWGLIETREWDGNEDAGGGATPGSMKVTIPFDIAIHAGANENAIQRNLGTPLDMTVHTNIHFDIKVDPASSMLSGWGAGQFGGINLYAFTPGWSFFQLGTDPWIGANAYGNWTHVVAPIDSLTAGANLNNVIRLGYQVWSGWADVGHTNAVTFWLDNVWIEYNTNNAPPPPPTLSVKPATSGLNLIASAPGSQYQRQGIRTLNPAYSWVGSFDPVTYSVTIKDFPQGQPAGFQYHMFLVPGTFTGDNSPDWNRPNCIFFQVQNWGNGVGARLAFKTNAPSANAMFWGSGALVADFFSPTAKGTWTVTFHNNTDVTVTRPDGVSTNVTMPAEVATMFADPLYAYFGSQPNELVNIGQATVVSRIEISGVPGTPIADNFAGPDLDTAVWEKAADNAPGVLIAPEGSAWWVSWTLPDVGYALQASPTLDGEAWADPGLTPIQLGTWRAALVPVDVPDAKTGFFRLLKAEQ